MAGEGGRRSMFKVKTPRFSTIILDDSAPHEKLCLPKLFTAEYGALLPEKLLLKLPSGVEWQVGLLKSGEKIWFHEGWQAFAQFYGVAPGHLLVFQYDSHGRFLVLMFDKTSTEIDYQTHEANGRVESEIRIDISDDSSDDHLSSPEARERSPLRSPRTKKLKRRNESGRVGRTSEAIFCRGSTSRVQVASEAANAFTPKTPSFKIAVADSHLSMGQVTIPQAFCVHVKEVYDKVELRVVGGECWPVKIRRCSRKAGKQAKFLGIGWGAFAKGNSLEVGDVCVHELVKPEDENTGKTTMVLNVHVFKG